MEIIGYRNYKFEPKDNDPIDMVQIYYTYDLSKGTGKGCRNIQISKAKLDKAGVDLHVGAVKEFVYDYRGKIVDIRYED